MSIFDIFKRKQEYNITGPDLVFGRYSDAFKDEAKQVILEDSITLYENGKRIESVCNLLEFLRNDFVDNVQYDVEENNLFFEIIQGSKRIIGRCNADKLVAISDIASISSDNIGLYRRLLEKNYLLKYIRFAVHDTQLCLKFDSFMQDASPQKLYNALRELAINADKYDDILIDEFEELNDTNQGEIKRLDSKITDVKQKFVREELAQVLDVVQKMKGHSESFQKGLSYLLLSYNYKLDYLVKPEGYIMEVLERNHRLFFSRIDQDASKKNKIIIKNFEDVLERSSQQIVEECYETTHTFGYNPSSSHNDLVALIDEEMPKINYYLSQKEKEIAFSIPMYIASYALFNFGLPQPDVDLLHLLMNCMEEEYFQALGFSQTYLEQNQLQEKKIKSRIEDIKNIHRDFHPEFLPESNVIQFTTLFDFSRTFLMMMKTYNLHYRSTNS